MPKDILRIENLLKRKDSKKQFIVIENNLKKCSSTAWLTFGLPARKIDNGTCERIHGCASCFQCETKYVFQSDGSDSTKHWLRHVCSKSALLAEDSQSGPLDKLLKPREKAAVTINSKDSIRIKNALTKWVCRSVHPFHIVDDGGLTREPHQVIKSLKAHIYTICSTKSH